MRRYGCHIATRPLIRTLTKIGLCFLLFSSVQSRASCGLLFVGQKFRDAEVSFFKRLNQESHVLKPVGTWEEIIRLLFGYAATKDPLMRILGEDIGSMDLYRLSQDPLNCRIELSIEQKRDLRSIAQLVIMKMSVTSIKQMNAGQEFIDITDKRMVVVNDQESLQFLAKIAKTSTDQAVIDFAGKAVDVVTVDGASIR